MAGLLDHAAHSPEKLAVVFGDGEERLTYRQLEARSRKIAIWLRDQGLSKGDCVAMLMPNSTTLFEVYWATQRIGLYLTPLNWHSTSDEIAYILENCDAKFLLADASLEELARYALAACTNAMGAASLNGPIAGFDDLDQGLGDIAPSAKLPGQTAGSVMIYSSGTTGQPKGIRRPIPDLGFDDDAFANATTHVMRTFGFTGEDTYLCPAPLYHAGPLRSCSAMHMLGATVVVMHRFDAAKTLESIEQQNVTVAQFVPTHFKRMLDLPEPVRKQWRLDGLRIAVHAAAPCPPQVKQQMIDWWGPILLEYYAGTEGGGVMIDSHEWLERPGSVGRPWSGLEVGILNEDGAITATPNCEGAIYFRNTASNGLNFEYHKDPEKTADAHHGDWFTLGDIGYLDEGGYLYLTDRKTNLIISGGVNIYPQEAEDTLIAHPKVHDAAVIGVPDEAMGEAVKAVVVPAKEVTGDADLEAELIAYTHSKLAKFKCPRSVDFVEALPRTDTGKLQKRIVRDRYWRGHTNRLVG